MSHPASQPHWRPIFRTPSRDLSDRRGSSLALNGGTCSCLFTGEAAFVFFFPASSRKRQFERAWTCTNAHRGKCAHNRGNRARESVTQAVDLTTLCSACTVRAPPHARLGTARFVIFAPFNQTRPGLHLAFYRVLVKSLNYFDRSLTEEIAGGLRPREKMVPSRCGVVIRKGNAKANYIKTECFIKKMTMCLFFLCNHGGSIFSYAKLQRNSSPQGQFG